MVIEGDQQKRHRMIRKAGLDLARCILDYTPVGREQDLAMERVEEAVMWANASIARKE